MRRTPRAGRLSALAAAALLAACASAPPPAAGPIEVPTPAATRAEPPADNRLADFERQQVELAQAAESRGHWAKAALVWEVLTLVNPEDSSHQSRWTTARKQAERLATERQAAADTAQRRGDLDAATRAWLEVLALDPGRTQAADALRLIERERVRRTTVGRFASSVGARRGPAEMPPPEATDPVRSTNSVREHASMLVQQGDLDGAIQLLKDTPPARADARLRRQLADLYVQKADALKQRQPEAARANVDAALAIDRRHAGALALQQQLPPARPRASTPSPSGR